MGFGIQDGARSQDVLGTEDPHGSGIQDPNTIGLSPEDAARRTTGIYGGDSGYRRNLATGQIELGLSSAQREVDRYRYLGGMAEGRQAYQADQTQANQDRYASYLARGEQAQALSMMAARARGQNSIANIMAQQQMQRAAAEQASMAASARGPAALALAQQNAAANTANMQGNVAGQASLAAAQERLAAEQAYMAGASGMRGQDFAAQGLSQQQAATQMQSELAQRQLNQQASLGYESLGMDVNRAQLQAGLQNKAIDYGQAAAMNQLQEAKDARNQAFWGNVIAGTSAGAGSAVTGLAMMDRRDPNHGNPNQPSDARAKMPLRTVMMSDVASKEPAGAVPLYEPEGTQLHMTPDGRAVYASAPTEPEGPSISGTAPRYSVARGTQAPSRARAGGDAPPKRQRSKREREDEASRWADRELASTRERTANLAFERPAVDQMADANRSMAASAYQYRPEWTPSGQAQGEPNVGPMAQTMAQNPVTATAVRQDPRTGMLVLDQGKLTKVLAGSVANLQQQIDAMRSGALQGREDAYAGQPLSYGGGLYRVMG